MGAYLAYILPTTFFFVLATIGLAFIVEEGETPLAMAILGPVVIIVFTLALLAFMFYLPAAITRLAIRRSFGAAFEVQENIEFIKRNVSNYLLALLIVLLANFISQFGIFLFCVGIFPASFWGTSVVAYAMGEVALRDGATASQASPQMEVNK